MDCDKNKKDSIGKDISEAMLDNGGFYRKKEEIRIKYRVE